MVQFTKGFKHTASLTERIVRADRRPRNLGPEEWSVTGETRRTAFVAMHAQT